jgi:hypothetical protein
VTRSGGGTSAKAAASAWKAARVEARRRASMSRKRWPIWWRVEARKRKG